MLLAPGIAATGIISTDLAVPRIDSVKALGSASPAPESIKLESEKKVNTSKQQRLFLEIFIAFTGKSSDPLQDVNIRSASMLALITSIILVAIPQSIGKIEPTVVELLTLPITPESSITLRLESVSMVSSTGIVVHRSHGRESWTQMNASQVKMWKAKSLDGLWSGFLAFSPSGGLGWLEANGQRLVLMGSEENSAELSKGLRPGPWHLEPEGRPSAPPIEDLCRVMHRPDDQGSIAGAAIPGVNIATLPRLVEMAVDADYEFVSMFATPTAAIDYILALYGANSFILERDCNTRLRMNYIRTFDSADDLYNEPDPLGPFRNEWNANQTSVTRDLAQLLTGRRDLPYGGVAWLNAACTNYGYSVSGYMIGSFADSTQANPGNWDIIVSTHEIGHNIGTLHTHNYGIDTCASGAVQRGTIMSYCHVVSGATSNIDLRFHRGTAEVVVGWEVNNAPCLASDCNSNGISDAEEIASGALVDSNADGIPDLCQDCDTNGVLDPIQIAAGAADVDQNGRPDSCDIDCNGNGVPDLADIAGGLTADDDGNFIPDSCQTDCDGNGVADGVDLIVNVSRDLDRDGMIDSCEDCNGNGIADPTDLAGALGLWTVQFSPALLIELDGRSGVQRRTIDPASAGIQSFSAIETALDGSLLLAAIVNGESALFRFNRATVALTRITPSGSGFPIANKLRLVPGTSGSLAACDVLDPINKRITRWRLNDGATLGTMVQLASGLSPRSFARQASAYLIINADGTIVRSATEGSAPVLFGSLAVGADATDILVASDGRVLVSDRASDSIQKFSSTGAPLGRFDVGPVPTSSVALIDPQSLMTARQNPSVIFILTAGASAAVHGHRLTDGYYLRTYRIYRVDAVGSDGFTQISPSPLDIDMNFELDSCQGSLSADLNHDGHVNGLDMTTLLSAWGSSNVFADINRDGIVSGLDLASLLSGWTG